MCHALLADRRAHRSNERDVKHTRQRLDRLNIAGAAAPNSPSLPARALSLPASSAPDSAPIAPADWRLGSHVPQTSNTLLQRIGYGTMRLLGWNFSGAFPDRSQFVAVVAPHTSNWDFLILLAAKWALKLDARWMGKDALFKAPLGWFMRAVGGIPIRRTGKHNVVDSSIQAFQERPQLVLTLAPEGTRRYVAEWKSGFWHIARGARVPIVCIALDYGRKTIKLGPEIFPTDDDPAVGIARIRANYADVKGYRPGQHS